MNIHKTQFLIITNYSVDTKIYLIISFVQIRIQTKSRQHM